MKTKPVVKFVEADATGQPVPQAEPMMEELEDGTVVPMESNPTCERCGHTFAEPREGKACCVCLEKAWKKAKVVEVIEHALGSPGAPQGRPTLEVAIETHRNLQKRVEALCVRLLTWSDVGEKEEVSLLRGLAEDAMAKFRGVGNSLATLQAHGFVAKATHRSRIEARLAAHQPVKLRGDVRAIWKTYYSEEELDQAEITGRDKVAGLVWVKLGKREDALPIPVKLSQLLAG